jgi:molybdopterin/thiamine biosynthesis adenylyltransferase
VVLRKPLPTQQEAAGYREGCVEGSQRLAERYDAQLRLPEIGRAGQARLRRGRVLIVGVGGLGCPAAVYLAAAGVGTLGLIDSDAVELSNLHRQILYRTGDLGRRKVAAAAERLAGLNPDVAVKPFDQRLTAHNLSRIFPHFDFVIDGTDRVESKYLVNDGAVLHRLPFSHAGILGLQGQTMTVVPGQSACLRCLFPVPPAEGEVATCQEAGVLGALAGTLGLVQAAEALKHLLGTGALLTNRLLSYDASTGHWRAVALRRSRHCPLCGDTPTIRQVEAIQTTDWS